MRRWSVFLLAGCGGPSAPAHSATWTVAGELVGPRAVDDASGGRVSCVVSDDVEGYFDGTPYLTLSFIGAGGSGLHLVAPGWRGVGAIAPTSILVTDGVDMIGCDVPGPHCFGLAGGTCTVTVDSWVTGELLTSGAHAGAASGTFACQDLANDGGQVIDLRGGRFDCRASDWTGR